MLSISKKTKEEKIKIAIESIEDSKKYDSIYKPKNLKIIEIDGIDCVGKETFAYELKLFLTKELRNRNNILTVNIQSFPAYDDTIFGSLLYDILRDDDLKSKIPNWQELFYIDQYNMFKIIFDLAHNNPNNEYIYILDRGPISNVLYQTASKIRYNFTDELGKKVVHKEIESNFSKLEPWVSLFGLPDILILMGLGDDRDKIKKYEEFLENKENKDDNEVIDYQYKVDNVLRELPKSEYLNLLGKIKPVIFNIGYQETWGNPPNPDYKWFLSNEHEKIQWTNIRIHRLIAQAINRIL